MDNESRTTGHGASSSVTVRDLLAIGFRQQRTVVVSFLVIFAGVLSFVLLGPAQYEAEMKILVKRERADPVVTAGQSAQGQLWLGVSEEELNSEVELLKSRDLLAKVVVATDLHQHDAGIGSRIRQMLGGAQGGSTDERRIARAAEEMAGKLAIQPLRKSNVIQVRYASPDPALSAAVLNKLADHYLEKHLAVHRPPGAFAFFEREAERYRGQMTLVQARLEQNSRDEGVVSVDTEKEATLRRVADLEALEQAARVQIK